MTKAKKVKEQEQEQLQTPHGQEQLQTPHQEVTTQLTKLEEIRNEVNTELGKYVDMEAKTYDVEGAYEMAEKSRIELGERKFDVSEQTIEQLKMLKKTYFDKMSKSITVASTYKGLSEALNSDKLSLSAIQLDFIGELYGKIEFFTDDEVNLIESIQQELNGVYTELYLAQMRVKFIAEGVQKIENAHRMNGLEVEEGVELEQDEVVQEQLPKEYEFPKDVQAS